MVKTGSRYEINGVRGSRMTCMIICEKREKDKRAGEGRVRKEDSEKVIGKVRLL